MRVKNYLTSLTLGVGLIFYNTPLSALEENLRYCGTYTYDFLYHRFKYDVEDAEIIRDTDSFVAYNLDGLGIGFSRNSNGMYMFFGFQDDSNFNTASPLDDKEVCPILEEILSEERFF